MQQDFNLILGPLLGFLFTAGTLLFVAMNAHRTVAAVPATGHEGSPAPAEPVATTTTTEPVTPVEPAPAPSTEAPAPESTREGT